MTNNIELLKEHDVFNAIGVCAWCGEETGKFAFLDNLPNDEKSPVHMILNYDPCDECRKEWRGHIVCIEVTEIPPNKDALPILIHEDIQLYPTSRHFCVPFEDAKEIGVSIDEIKDPINDFGIGLVYTETFAKAFPDE